MPKLKLHLKNWPVLAGAAVGVLVTYGVIPEGARPEVLALLLAVGSFAGWTE